MGGALLQREQKCPNRVQGIRKIRCLQYGQLCKLCKYKNPDFKAFGVKTKISNCASWSGCVKHVENVHYLHDPKDVEEALTNPKAHWDDLEDRKARLQGVDTRLQGQSTLDECMEEYGRGSAERKRCVVNLARLCAVENLPLHIGTRSWVCEVHEEVGTPMAEHIRTKRDEVSGTSKPRNCGKKSRGRWRK